MPLDPQAQVGALAKLLETEEGRLKAATALAAQGITPAMVNQQAGGLGGGGQALGADIAPTTLPAGPPALAPQAAPLPPGPPVLAAQAGAPAAAPPPPPPPPPPAPVPQPGAAPGAAGGAPGSLLQALGAVVAPPPPVQPQLPGGTAPLPRAGGSIDPRLIEQILALLNPTAGAGAAPASSLGALVTGRR